MDIQKLNTNKIIRFFDSDIIQPDTRIKSEYDIRVNNQYDITLSVLPPIKAESGVMIIL
ncbi:MAG: hypothetical protein IKY98_05720 [Alphaproteobacteria bacterium]|nr:hypothetical protein [Alphaproteobacteria bacterium]